MLFYFLIDVFVNFAAATFNSHFFKLTKFLGLQTRAVIMRKMATQLTTYFFFPCINKILDTISKSELDIIYGYIKTFNW